MDPNEILRLILDQTKTILATPHQQAERNIVLAERIEALDEWLKKGGAPAHRLGKARASIRGPSSL